MAQLSPASTHIPDNIRREMYVKRINQTDLGQATGLSQTQLSRRLLGRIPFTVDELDRIAGVLGIELTELIAPTP